MGRWALSPCNVVVLPVILHATPERPPVFKRACPAGVEGVLPQQIDVVPGQGREVGEVLVRDLLARGAQRGNGVLQVRGGPRANRGDQQVETTCTLVTCPSRAGAYTPDGLHELLPQEQVLHHECLAALERTEPDADDERQPFPHGVMVAHRRAA